MSQMKIADQTWGFSNVPAVEKQLVPLADSEAAFPVSWRVFGPVGPQTTRLGVSKRGLKAEPLVSADVTNLTTIPAELHIGDQTLPAQDAQLHDDTLDFDALFGGRNSEIECRFNALEETSFDHTPGYQAYAMTEVTFDQPTEVIFGAGADNWMQWWIDGSPLFDTLETGNSEASIGKHNITKRHTFTSGRHLIVVRVISGGAGWVLKAGFVDPEVDLIASRDPHQWEVLPDMGLIHSPCFDHERHLAVRTDRCWKNETVAARFTTKDTNCQYGLAFGVQNKTHFYWAYVPRWSQNFRARALWAAIAKFDGDGRYPIVLKSMLMPIVKPHPDTPLDLRVERRDGWIEFLINGVKGPRVFDESFGPGHAGIFGAHPYTVSNFQVQGESVDAKPWADSEERSQLWTSPVAVPDPMTSAWPLRLVKLSTGELVSAINNCTALDAEPTPNTDITLLVSGDAGRSWQYHGRVALAGTAMDGQVPGERKQGGDDPVSRGWSSFCDPLIEVVWVPGENGAIRQILCGPAVLAQRRGFSEAAPDGYFMIQDSHDKGLTWTEPRQSTLIGDWATVFLDGFTLQMHACTQLDDGSIIIVLTRQFPGFYDRIPNHDTKTTWGARLTQPFATRSTDGGLTWQAPVPMDNAADFEGTTPDAPVCDFTETPVAQMPDGRLLAISRPFMSPFSWFTDSLDGGQTWSVARYLPFSLSGNPRLVATQSGYLVAVGRGGMGGLTMFVSSDGGLNWDEGTLIDSSCLFNGFMIECEPDTVLIHFTDLKGSPYDITQPSVRQHRVRITPEGPQFA